MEDTYTRSTVTPSSILRKPQSTAHSPIDTVDTVRNIVTLWKQRTPATEVPSRLLPHLHHLHCQVTMMVYIVFDVANYVC